MATLFGEATENQFLFCADADQTAAFSDGAGDVLANPPDCVADKLDFLGVVKAASGFDKAHIAFVDELVHVDALTFVKVSDVHYKAEVAFDQQVHGFAATFADFSENNLFLFLGKQRVFRNIVQVLEINIPVITNVRILNHINLVACCFVYIRKSTSIFNLKCHRLSLSSQKLFVNFVKEKPTFVTFLS